MIVKIMRSFNLYLIFLFVVMFSLIAIFLVCYTNFDKQLKTLDCSSNFYIYQLDGEEGVNQPIGVIKMSFHISKDGSGMITESGHIRYNAEDYVVNRYVSIIVNHEYGYHYALTRSKPVINHDDNLPAIIYETLVSKGPVLYYDIRLGSDNLVVIRDSKRAVFLCRNKH